MEQLTLLGRAIKLAASGSADAILTGTTNSSLIAELEQWINDYDLNEFTIDELGQYVALIATLSETSDPATVKNNLNSACDHMLASEQMPTDEFLDNVVQAFEKLVDSASEITAGANRKLSDHSDNTMVKVGKLA